MKIEIDAIKVSQPIGDFYFGKIKAELLYQIAEADVRRLENEDREVESYLGIQRPLKKNRVNEINDYIKTIDATFPNSIILAINEDEDIDILWEENKLTIEFPEKKRTKIANILDGQHRLAGFNEESFKYEGFDGNEKNFELLVTIFLNADMSVQAKVFSMVNQNQTKVNKSLVYDLESLSKSRSPWRTCHLIAVYLNSLKKSPFYRRIKRLGVKSRKDEVEPLTQAAFVENLVKLISPAPQEDRNYILGKDRGIFSFSKTKPSHMSRSDLSKFPFRKAFFDDKDEIILKTVFEYFLAVQSVWPKSWDKENSDSVLNKTVGLIALMRLLGVILSNNKFNISASESISSGDFTSILESTGIDEDYFCSLEATSKTGVKIFQELKEGIDS